MFEYIFVTNIFEYSNIRIYSSHSALNELERHLCLSISGLFFSCEYLLLVCEKQLFADKENFSTSPSLCSSLLCLGQTHRGEKCGQLLMKHILFCVWRVWGWRWDYGIFLLPKRCLPPQRIEITLIFMICQHWPQFFSFFLCISVTGPNATVTHKILSLKSSSPKSLWIELFTPST